MEELRQINTMLQLISQPAFRVEDGMISHVNQAASAYLIQPGMPFAPMILCGAEEYAQFSDGKLYVNLTVGNVSAGACISRIDSGDIVTLEQPTELPQLQSLVLAANALKAPLMGILCNTQRMLPEVAPEGSEWETAASKINRDLYKMLRIVTNMSDASAYAQSQSGRMETIEVCVFFQEILEKVATLAQAGGITLEYTLPQERIFTLSDQEKLERAIHNLLSNAIKFSPAGSSVQAKLVQQNKRLYFSVSNARNGSGVSGRIYNHFMREPNVIEDPKSGLGLGMVMVRTAATIHGGAVLLEENESLIRVTMTMQIQTNTSTQMRSPIRHFDYAGEMDHVLLELADVLPAQHYTSENIK